MSGPERLGRAVWGLEVLALDVGGSHVTAARVRVEPDRAEIGPGSLLRLALNEHAPADELLDALARAALAAGREPAALAAVGVGMPGPFDYRAGVGRFTANAKFASLHGVDVGAALRARLPQLAPLPLHFLNDAAAFALGEAVRAPPVGRGGAGAGRTLGVTLGTGLGSGFVQDGRVLMDGPGVAREGQIGWEPYLDATAEDYVSTRRLSADYAALTGEHCRPVEIAGRAGTGDKQALQVFAAYGQHLGAVLSGWARAFSPGLVVLGGNLCAARALFGPALEQALTAGLGGRSLPDLAFSQDGEAAALLGAAWSARPR